MISRVSVGVRFGIPSRGTSEPRTRMVGGAPEVMWRSEALCSTTLSRMSAKSKFMPPGASASRWSPLSGAAALAGAGDACDLGDRRQPATDLLEAVLAQAHHALVHRGVHDRLGRLARDRERADGVAHPHDLVEADPALVARAAAAGAADGLVGLEVQAD